MTVRIQRMETTVEITPPTAPRREPETTQTRGEDAASHEAFRQAIMTVFASELDQYTRSRGH